MAPADTGLIESYDHFERIEATFGAALDESLNPRGSDLLYDLVAKLALPGGAKVLDLGCGKGNQAVELAERFGFEVHGIDPVTRHIELCNELLAEAATRKPELRRLVTFGPGTAEAIPAADAAFDLIWSRDMIVLIDALDKAFAECRRVLRSSGRMLIYGTLATDRLEPREAELLAETGRTRSQQIEAAFAAAGFEVEESIDLGGEFGERLQEDSGEPGRRLIHASRLLRAPDRYITAFGQTAYDIMLSDCLWHVYRLIGKLSARVYLLKLT
jgi:SAM-dependent methyltransferase